MSYLRIFPLINGDLLLPFKYCNLTRYRMDTTPVGFYREEHLDCFPVSLPPTQWTFKQNNVSMLRLPPVVKESEIDEDPVLP